MLIPSSYLQAQGMIFNRNIVKTKKELADVFSLSVGSQIFIFVKS